MATQANASDERDQFIPIRKSDILGALIDSGLLAGAEQQEKFRQLCRLLGAIFHYEYFDELEKVRDDYYYFNPEIALDSRLDGEKQVSDHVYFRNVSNNAGIFDYVVGAAEEQECKEAFLAYCFLLTASPPLDQATLDAHIEEWLKKTFGVDIDFEVDDALAKLERLGLLEREGEQLSVQPLDEALVVLDRIWDEFFLYANVADATSPQVRGVL